MESKARETLGGIDGHPPRYPRAKKLKAILIYIVCSEQGDKAAIKPATGSFSRVKWNRFDFVSNEMQGAAIRGCSSIGSTSENEVILREKKKVENKE